jgi:UrcA family protein
MKTSARFALALSTCLSLGWSATALGATSSVGDLATKTVSFRDLDIGTAVGAEALYGRIVTAARAVCRESFYAVVVECRSHAVNEAVKGVGSPLLSSIHRSTVERVEEVVLR